MDASSTADFPTRTLEMPPWKTVLGHLAALFTAILFIGAGVYKIVDPFTVQTLFEQLKVPYQVSLPLVLALGVGETFGGVMILVPRFRRWGSWLLSALLIVFMAYIGFHYKELVGQECSCFPWIKRTVGPAFFAGDMAFLVAAVVAGWWARPAATLRSAVVILGAVAVFAAVSFGSALTHQSGTKAPDSITVEGQPYSLQHGRVFLFFYDPHCSHCDQAAQDMSKLKWKQDVTVIAIPTNDGRFAAGFLHDTNLKALTSLDLDVLKKIFPFGDPPFGVFLENGRQKGSMTRFEDGGEPGATLRKFGYVE